MIINKKYKWKEMFLVVVELRLIEVRKIMGDLIGKILPYSHVCGMGINLYGPMMFCMLSKTKQIIAGSS